MLIQYVSKNLGAAKLSTIEKANSIIEEYQTQGYELTLRQLYYQFVARGLIANNMKEYKRLGDVLNDGRLCGLVSWEAIVDRTRNLQSNQHWESPKQIVEACASGFQIDKWENQDYRVEVWIEKDALVGVIENVCQRNDVSYFSCRGYTSQSELWSAAMRMKRYENEGQNTIVIHLGDHDPSGIDMSRDIQDRLHLFGADTEVIRIALNMDQVEEYGPPPNPAKITDSRADKYIKKFGRESWELDALDPKTIDELVESYIEKYQHGGKWQKKIKEEKSHRNTLLKAARGME